MYHVSVYHVCLECLAAVQCSECSCWARLTLRQHELKVHGSSDAVLTIRDINIPNDLVIFFLSLSYNIDAIFYLPIKHFLPLSVNKSQIRKHSDCALHQLNPLIPLFSLIIILYSIRYSILLSPT